MSKTKTVPLASLVEDFSLYPRHGVDEVHVSDLVRSIEAGNDLPVIVVEEGTLRLVDGFHRARAYRRALGDDGKVEVELRTYASEAELFEDAARLNAGHGRKLNRVDQVRVVYRARELGLDDDRIASALAVPTERVKVLAVRVAETPSGDHRALKLGAHHLAGRTLTDEQIKVVRQMRGARTGRLVSELRMLLESGVANLNDEGVREGLLRLADLIKEKIGEAAEVA